MASVYLTTTADNGLVPTSHDDYLRMLDSAQHDRYRRHPLVERPEEADIILFVGSLESDFWDVRRHPLVRRFPDRCFLYHGEDLILPFLPGVYPSLQARDNLLGRAVAGGYTAVLHVDIPFLPFKPDAKYLFSFRGTFASHPRSREPLRQLMDHPRGLVVDLSTETRTGSVHAPGEHRRTYIDLLRETKFALCPRGRSPSSWRLFETLAAGRVPVIMGDAWMPPPITPNWDSFAIRVREKDLRHVPSILEEREADAEALSVRAREVWDDWFSMEAFFHRTVDWCVELQARRRLGERYARHVMLAAFLRPFNIRNFLLPRAKTLALNGLKARG